MVFAFFTLANELSLKRHLLPPYKWVEGERVSPTPTRYVCNLPLKKTWFIILNFEIKQLVYKMEDNDKSMNLLCIK